MKYLLIVCLCMLGMVGCSLNRYALITKDGILARNVDSRQSCELLIKKFNINGICIPM